MGEADIHNHQVDATPRERMSKLVESLSAYIEQYHGGWVRFVDYDGEVLKVEMGGACRGCSLSDTTLQGWVAGTVRQFFPEVKRIEEA
jgi:Fe-S cluster biogenesis protein NfuA